MSEEMIEKVARAMREVLDRHMPTLAASVHTGQYAEMAQHLVNTQARAAIDAYNPNERLREALEGGTLRRR